MIDKDKFSLEDMMKIGIALEVFMTYENKDCELVIDSESLGNGFCKWYLGFTHDEQPSDTVTICNNLINEYKKRFKIDETKS